MVMNQTSPTSHVEEACGWIVGDSVARIGSVHRNVTRNRRDSAARRSIQKILYERGRSKAQHMISHGVTCARGSDRSSTTPWFAVPRSWFAFRIQASTGSTDKESTAAVQGKARQGKVRPNHARRTAESLTSSQHSTQQSVLYNPRTAHSVSARQTAIYATIPRSRLRLL
jgi:hypothetical protein